MKTPSRAAKIAALSSFFILIAAFVAYRAGAFDNMIYGSAAVTGPVGKEMVRDTPPPEPDLIPSTKSAPVFRPSKDATNSKKDSNKNADDRPVIMPSSKSGPVFVPPKSDSTVNEKSAEPPRIMPSSKSGVIFDAPEPKPQKPDEKVIMGGSKSIQVISPQQFEQKED